jgi:hypothetical protein
MLGEDENADWTEHAAILLSNKNTDNSKTLRLLGNMLWQNRGEVTNLSFSLSLSFSLHLFFLFLSLFSFSLDFFFFLTCFLFRSFPLTPNQ